MKVLVACEFSGIVRDAFIRRGHNAISCDILPCERGGPHWLMDIRKCGFPSLSMFDLAICHPPCTDLAVSGARWFADKGQARQDAAVEFVMWLAGMPINRIAIENPIGVLSSKWREPDQILEPWHYGHGEMKATCLWLKNLPKLVPTHTLVVGREARVHKEPPGPDRWKNRSRTYQGIADAMAEQWSGLVKDKPDVKEAGLCDAEGRYNYRQFLAVDCRRKAVLRKGVEGDGSKADSAKAD